MHPDFAHCFRWLAAFDTATAVLESPVAAPVTAAHGVRWTPEGERELKKIPFFVRKKARRNTEAFAAEQGLAQISVETLYDAKAHFSR